MHTSIAIVLTLIALAAVPIPAVADRRPPREDESVEHSITLEQLRAIFEERHPTKQLAGPISLAGLNWHREIELGEGRRAVVVSCVLGGGLLVFDADGSLQASFRTWEIISVGQFDFDQDGSDEILVQQKDGTGTGVADWRFHVYQVKGRSIESLWQGLSCHYQAIDSSQSTAAEHGFVRAVPSGSGRAWPTLVHASGPVGGPLTEKYYVLRDGAFEAICPNLQ